MQPIWPFPGGVDWAQFRRDDEGVDLQYQGTTPVSILAIMPGTLTTAGPDPNGFGVAYPLLELDSPVMGFTAIYYGHTFPDWSVVGKHVSQGQTIGQTGGASSGGNAAGLSNWLEIGFWIPTLGNGVNMHTFLDTAVGSPATAPPPAASSGAPTQAETNDIQAVQQAEKQITDDALRLLWQRQVLRPAFRNGWRP